MRRMSLVLAPVLLGGLLISSQVMAAGQARQTAALTGEQNRQWHLTQEMAQNRDQLSTQQREGLQLNREQTREMQRLLSQQGYEVGHADGIIGRETRAALREFQAVNGLTLTGMPDQGTLRALAPRSSQHEFFGLAPEFGEEEEW